MDKCPKCGNKLSSIDVLCPKCGALVEVVQIKKGALGQNAASGLGIPIKKLPQQNLIVYNDEWPTDDTDMLSSQDDKPADTPDSMPFSEPDEVSELLKRLEEPAANIKAYSPEDELGSEENYLAMFRNMKLPALEDINASITGRTEYIEHVEPIVHTVQPTQARHSEYAVQPKQFEPQPVEPAPVTVEPAQHRWLEIEELSDGARTNAAPSVAVVDSVPEAAVPEDVSVPMVALSEETPHYRSRSERRQAAAAPPPQQKRGAGRAILMVFVWLLITGALFCGFFFLDQYVTEHYGTYPAMLYDWSGGNIDLAPSVEPSPTPLEAPAP